MTPLGFGNSIGLCLLSCLAHCATCLIDRSNLGGQALKGDGDLAEALYRNVYGLDSGKRKQAELLAKYVQRELACLSMTDSQFVMAGKVKFSTDFLLL